MQQKVFGADRSGATGGSGQLTMSFEQAKKAAESRRAEQFEANRQRFFGEDGWDKAQVTAATNNFWGC